MVCTELALEVQGTCGALPVGDVVVDLAIAHTWIGDLTIKLISPEGTLTTLMSRPGLIEDADDGEGCCGDSSDLSEAATITFIEGGMTDAEDMGSTLEIDGVVCIDDMLCEYDPNPGAGPGFAFEDYVGEAANGTWTLCVGDSGFDHEGTLHSFGISVVVD